MTTPHEELAEPQMPTAAFGRALLKLSGESLMGDREYGVDPRTVTAIASEVVAVQRAGTDIAVVVGGGNFYRGMSAAAEGMDRATADYAGMLATLLNALALQDALEPLSAARWPILQSSANRSGGPDARRVDDVPASIRSGVDLRLDAGELPGTASTVVDQVRPAAVVLDIDPGVADADAGAVIHAVATAAPSMPLYVHRAGAGMVDLPVSATVHRVRTVTGALHEILAVIR